MVSSYRRIHEEHPNVLEVIELSPSKEFPSFGLRLAFQEALSPFAFLCEREVCSFMTPYTNRCFHELSGTLETRLLTSVAMQGRRQGELVYMLYVLTVSGVALLCHLRSPFSYVSGSVLHQDDIAEFNLQTQAQSAKVTAVTAKPGCIVIGRQDGSICSYSLGKLAPNSPGVLSTVYLQQQTHCSMDLVGSR